MSNFHSCAISKPAERLLLWFNYRHGFKNKYGHDIEHPTDTLLDPEHDEFLSTGTWSCDANAKKLNPQMTCDQRNLYCSGLAFSVVSWIDEKLEPHFNCSWHSYSYCFLQLGCWWIRFSGSNDYWWRSRLWLWYRR